MSAMFLLSRSARVCAGRVPLFLLLQKLVRSGENATAEALRVLLPCDSQRVRWMLCGNVLRLEVA